MLKELISNADGRLSTTATIQFSGFVILGLALIVAIIQNHQNAPEFFDTYALYCGGLTVSKGAVSIFKERA